MPIYVDMLDYPVDIPERPQRIVSLVPSLSLLMHDLGVGSRLVGVTKFCVNPNGLKRDSTIVGGTKLLRMDVIDDLQPDLIVANKEENNQSDIKALASKFPVYVTDITDFDEALMGIKAVGSIVDCRKEANNLIAEIKKRKENFSIHQATLPPLRVAYVIWNEPLMVAGGDTFIHAMLDLGGWHNAFSAYPRYPAVALEGFKTHKMDFIFLSSEPYPFKEKHKVFFKNVLPADKIILVDGEMFSWYGSKLLDSFDYFEKLHNALKSQIV